MPTTTPNRPCTYRGCKRCGVGKITADATHWLCTEHLAELRSARDSWARSPSIGTAQKMFSMTMLAGGAGLIAATSIGTVAAFAEQLRVANG